MPSANDNTASSQSNSKDGSLSQAHETEKQIEKSVDFKDLSTEEKDIQQKRNFGASSSQECSYGYSSASYQHQDYSSDEENSPQERGRSRTASPGSSRSSYVVIIDDHYSNVETPDTNRSIQRIHPRHRHSRPRYRRQLTYPAFRSRSLSVGRKQVRSMVPRIAPRLRVSRSRLDSLIPPAVLNNEESESDEEEKEEWQYVPFSFCSLPRRDKLILLSLGCIDLTLYMCLSILAPFYPSEAKSRGVSGTVSGWVFGCFALTQFLFSPIFGYLLPKLGSRFMVLSGHFVAGSCTVLFGFLDYIPYDDNGMLFVTYCFIIRVLLAIGCTASATASFSIMVNTFPDNIATVFGVLETFTGVGLMVGPALGGVLYEAQGFMLPFLSLGVIMILSVPFNMYILPTQNEDSTAVLESGSLWQVLCIPAVMVVSVATIIGALIWAILDPILEPHFQVYSLSPSMIGLIFLLMSAFYAISSPFWGWIADKVEDSTPLMVLGFLFSALGLLLLGPSKLLGFPSGYRQLWLDLIALIILGMSVSLAVIPTFEKILDAAEKAGVEDNVSMYSNVAGLWGGAYALGEFIGPSAGGFLVDEFGFDWCMTFTAAPCVLIAIMLFILWIYEKKVRPTPCLIRIPSAAKKKKPSVDPERRSLLEESRDEADLANDGSSPYGATVDFSKSVSVQPQEHDDYQPMTQSI